MLSVLDAAIGYANRGWRVFPVSGKVPLTDKGLNDATVDLAQINWWWKKWPDAGVGFATGDVAVLDIDPKNGGDKSLAKLFIDHGRLPTTGISKTGSGGWHYFFKPPAGIEVRNTTNLNGYQGIDVRGRGGYVVLPPSKHPNGLLYSWHFLPTYLATWPDYLLPERKEVFDSEKAKESWPEGTRNGTLARVAGSLHNYGLSGSALLDLLRIINQSKCNPPLPDGEVERIAASISRYVISDTVSTRSTRRREGRGSEGSRHIRSGSYGDPVPEARTLRNTRRTRVRDGAWYLGSGR